MEKRWEIDYLVQPQLPLPNQKIDMDLDWDMNGLNGFDNDMILLLIWMMHW